MLKKVDVSIDMNDLSEMNKTEEIINKVETSGKDKGLYIRLPEEKRDEYKMFCVKHHLKMNDFVKVSIDYMKRQIEGGKLVIADSGVYEIKN